SSNRDYFITTHYNLYVISPTDYTTHVEATYKKRKWDHYLLIEKLGKISINDISKFYIPPHFAKNIEYRLINDVFNHLCEMNNGPTWSSILNCQSFTRASIEYLGYDFPSTVEFGDPHKTINNFAKKDIIFVLKSFNDEHDQNLSFDTIE
ncbi:unnamed protein product, partial [Rotaria sp. Silwood2]